MIICISKAARQEGNLSLNLIHNYSLKHLKKYLFLVQIKIQMDFKMTAFSLQLVITAPAWFLVLKGSVQSSLCYSVILLTSELAQMNCQLLRLNEPAHHLLDYISGCGHCCLGRRNTQDSTHKNEDYRTVFGLNFRVCCCSHTSKLLVCEAAERSPSSHFTEPGNSKGETSDHIIPPR